ncbi:hypothetical protein [Sphingobium amiense]|uniref:hypothetical protein n=1 Tax=Sphingobium amiense TaxID=135719 RepID=UPI001E642ECF|nr:hypothetical protein [Sphingobium amiense]
MSDHDTANDFANIILRYEHRGRISTQGEAIVRTRVVVAHGEIAGFPKVNDLLLVETTASRTENGIASKPRLLNGRICDALYVGRRQELVASGRSEISLH